MSRSRRHGWWWESEVRLLSKFRQPTRVRRVLAEFENSDPPRNAGGLGVDNHYDNYVC